MPADQDRTKRLLTEAVSLLCRSLQFEEQITVEGLIGITIDKKEVFLVGVNELIQKNSPNQKRSLCGEEIVNSSSLCKKRKHINEDEATPKQINADNLLHPKIDSIISLGTSNGNTNIIEPVDIKTEQVEPENNNSNHDDINESPLKIHEESSSTAGLMQDELLQEEPLQSDTIETKNEISFASPDTSGFELSNDLVIKEEITDDSFGCFLIDLNSSNSNDLDSSHNDSSISDVGKWNYSSETILATGQFLGANGEVPSSSNNVVMSIMPTFSSLNGSNIKKKVYDKCNRNASSSSHKPDKRQRNNDACRKYREAKKIREQQLKESVENEKKRNEILEQRMLSLEKLIKNVVPFEIKPEIISEDESSEISENELNINKLDIKIETGSDNIIKVKSTRQKDACKKYRENKKSRSLQLQDNLKKEKNKSELIEERIIVLETLIKTGDPV